MIPESVLKQIVARIHATRELAGCVVGYCGGGTCRTIGYPSSVTPNSENVAVIIEEVLFAENAPQLPIANGGAVTTTGTYGEAFLKNWTTIGAEMIGAGVSCGLTVAAGGGIAAALAATPATAGLSWTAIGALWIGFGTGAIQCGNGALRVGAALYDPSLAILKGWDKNSFYAVAILLVDALGVATAVSSLPSTVRRVWDAFSRLRSFNALNLSFDALRRMGRVERLRVLTRVLDDATREGEGLSEIARAAKDAKIATATMSRATGLSQNNAATLVRIVKDETVRQLHGVITDLLATNAGLILSATPAKLTGSGSGSINWAINFIDAGQPVE